MDVTKRTNSKAIIASDFMDVSDNVKIKKEDNSANSEKNR